ncbi:hypothetical protein HU200_065418 [Digitaria exilis]|uniref:Uncharacterized protein n=1 Tax=Digitaria exilis TaxID=1010633 RepID=A0A835DUZ7_9POAL|nr:hypothetical protein HU200_065418 [Digitaria exilis]
MHLSSGGFVIPSCPPESQGAQVVEGNGHIMDYAYQLGGGTLSMSLDHPGGWVAA